MTKKDVSQSTVDKVAERLKKNSNISSEKARQIAVDTARKINQEKKQVIYVGNECKWKSIAFHGTNQ